jgi:uncharacterized protein YndB with AHSA1/START domain
MTATPHRTRKRSARSTAVTPDGAASAVVTSRTAVVAASPAAVFAVLSDPHQHAALDGSGLIRGVLRAPARLGPGAIFTMRMKGYTTTNTVVEYAPDALIAWRHRARHVWRWQVRAVPGGTKVTGTFDGTAKRAPRLVRLIGIPRRAGTALDGTITALQHRFR